jgi:hypothetical protein
MLDWKILAASFAALLVLSSVLLGGFGIGDFLAGAAEKVRELLGGAPFSGLFTGRGSPEQQITLALFPENFTLVPDSAVAIIIGDMQLNDFAGEIGIHFDSNELILDEKESSLSISLPITETEIKQVSLASLKVENAVFDVAPTISTENGTIEVTRFSGTVTITEKSVEFLGNVSSIKIKIGELELTTV